MGFAYGKNMAAGTDMMRITCGDSASDITVEDLHALGQYSPAGPTADNVNDYHDTKVMDNSD